MEDTQTAQLLMDILLQNKIMGIMAATKVMRKLPAISYSDKIDVNGMDLFDVSQELLQSYGRIVGTDNINRVICAIVGSGAMNMNPAALVVRTEEGVVYASAAAKEGLIKQRTAEKAVNHFFDLLKSKI